MMTRPFFLAIEGPIGVGKTTLARLLQSRFKAGLLLEAFEENPFLSDFYADRARYAFQTQMFFLLSRYRQQRAVPSLLVRGPLVADYTFGKDSLFARLNLTGDELDVYDQLHRVLADRVPVANLVIYLRADLDVLMARIATRDRTYEREMDRAYIESVHQAYERYFADYTRTLLLTLDTDDLNYVQDPSALAFIEGRVRTALGIGAYQQPFPQMEPVDSTLTETAPATPEWSAMREFLAANEILGRVGIALAGGALERSEEELRASLRDAMARLDHLARAAGVDLRETG
jgi:deoxyadenosine/deoxycytidine kinase